jgi:ribonuclease T2
MFAFHRIRPARAAAVLAFSILMCFAAAAQEQRRGEPGQFDFYVLALSWSPSYCEAARERTPDRAPQQQCAERPYHFVVHGLWPQYERGFPRDCRVPAPRLNRNIVSSMLDLMPSPRLVFNEWDRHGTCSGLEPQAYFDAVRKSYASVKIPDKFLNVTNYLTVTPDEVEDAFVAANPGMSRGAVAVTCDTRRLSEVRICLSKELRFRDCPEVDRRACRRDKIAMPPMRGGS